METLRLADIVTIQKGKKVSRVFDEKISGALRYIQIKDLRNDNDIQYTNELDLIIADYNDIIIAWDGTNAGDIGLNLHGVIGSTLSRISLKKEYADLISPYYLGRFLNSINKEIKNNTIGIAIPHINPNHFNNIKFPYFDIEYQNKVAKSFSIVERLNLDRNKTLEKLDTLTEALFFSMFGDPIVALKGNNTVLLGELGDWKSGGTPSRSVDENFSGTIPWYSSGELNDIYLGESREFINEDSIANSSAKIIQEGSLLLAMYDSAALKSSIALKECSCNQAIAFCKLEKNKCSIIYVYYAIQLSKEYHLSSRRGARQKNLNLSMIKNLKIFLPDLELQFKFEDIHNQVYNLKNKIKFSQSKLKELFSSMLQKAFKGELSINEMEVFEYTLGELSQDDFLKDPKKIDYLLTLLDKTDSHIFSNLDTYDLAKEFLFSLLRCGKVKQSEINDEIKLEKV